VTRAGWPGIEGNRENNSVGAKAEKVANKLAKYGREIDGKEVVQTSGWCCSHHHDSCSAFLQVPGPVVTGTQVVLGRSCALRVALAVFLATDFVVVGIQDNPAG
jgi:hypothetical protein